MPPDLFLIRLLGAPATRAVLDGGYAARAASLAAALSQVIARGDGGDAHRPLDLCTRDARTLRVRFFGSGLVALCTAAKAARGVQVSGGGSGGTHGVFILFRLVRSASRPSASAATSN